MFKCYEMKWNSIESSLSFPIFRQKIVLQMWLSTIHIIQINPISDRLHGLYWKVAIPQFNWQLIICLCSRISCAYHTFTIQIGENVVRFCCVSRTAFINLFFFFFFTAKTENNEANIWMNLIIKSCIWKLSVSFDLVLAWNKKTNRFFSAYIGCHWNDGNGISFMYRNMYDTNSII